MYTHLEYIIRVGPLDSYQVYTRDHFRGWINACHMSRHMSRHGFATVMLAQCAILQTSTVSMVSTETAKTSVFVSVGSPPPPPVCAAFCAACGRWCCKQAECTNCPDAHLLPGCQKPPPSPRPPPTPPRVPTPPAPPPNRASYWTEGAHILTDAWNTQGLPVHIKGVSWSGLELSPCYIRGGNVARLDSYASFLVSNKFNAVRIPLALDELLADEEPAHPGQSASRCASQGELYYRSHNPEFEGLSYVAQLVAFVKLLRDHGLLVLLDMHVGSATLGRSDGLPQVDAPQPSTAFHSLPQVDARDDGTMRLFGGLGRLLAGWQKLAETLCDEASFWNVLGADLRNSPHGLTWGDQPHGEHALSSSTADQGRWDEVATVLRPHDAPARIRARTFACTPTAV